MYHLVVQNPASSDPLLIHPDSVRTSKSGLGSLSVECVHIDVGQGQLSYFWAPLNLRKDLSEQPSRGWEFAQLSVLIGVDQCQLSYFWAPLNLMY